MKRIGIREEENRKWVKTHLNFLFKTQEFHVFPSSISLVVFSFLFDFRITFFCFNFKCHISIS